MVAADKKTLLHVVEILGVVAVAHHFWPKGITYGEKEDWEKAYRKKHAYKSSKRVRDDSSGGSRSDQSRRPDRNDRYLEYEERNDRYYDDRYREERPRTVYYEDRPTESKRMSARY